MIPSFSVCETGGLTAAHRLIVRLTMNRMKRPRSPCTHGAALRSPLVAFLLMPPS